MFLLDVLKCRRPNTLVLHITPKCNNTFIELSDLEMLTCRQLDNQLCKFNSGFSKRSKKKLCAIALFTNDEKQVNVCCQTQFTQWNGQEIANLGQNRWAFSTSGPHDVVFSCPPDSKHLPPQRLQLPAIGYFEVPPGCTARTEDWIFPASLEGSTTAAAVPIPAKHYKSKNGNSRPIPFIKYLSFQSDSPLSTNCSNTTYPFEWIVAFVFTILAICGLAGFTLRLAQRLNNHLKNNMGIYETADYHTRGRKPDPGGENFIHSQDVEL
ncbi:Uncharacterized protein APZ42_021594 [Daphnia magna]|uniref:Uncharacterized protein n=1 Tax=Daphnia magna TaxID=35525 RepID=A0A164WJM2_9CRUS|nr:Uncharacterized protein APZ42_021594 [Daphnia magna]